MAKETTLITITKEDYDNLKVKEQLYMAVAGILMTGTTKDTEKQYNYNKMGDGIYFEDTSDCIKKILTVIKFFDPLAYAHIAGNVSYSFGDLSDIASLFADDEDDEDEDPEGDA